MVYWYNFTNSRGHLGQGIYNQIHHYISSASITSIRGHYSI